MYSDRKPLYLYVQHRRTIAIRWGATYTLPKATTTTLGGVTSSNTLCVLEIDRNINNPPD